jgi:hypothetical protein
MPSKASRTLGFYQLFEIHFDSYVRAYEERFEARSGPLRPAVVRSVEEFLSCGRIQPSPRLRLTSQHRLQRIALIRWKVPEGVSSGIFLTHKEFLL